MAGKHQFRILCLTCLLVPVSVRGRSTRRAFLQYSLSKIGEPDNAVNVRPCESSHGKERFKMAVAPKANPPLRILLGPGPSPVNPRVLQSLSLPVVGHLDPAFLKIMDESTAMLRELFQTKNQLALPMSGTGSAGMETCFVNLIEPGDGVLIGVNGVFGTRMVDVAQRCGAQVDTVDAAWGT